MIEKEPVTVILSQRGWIRAARGHVPLDGDFKFKEGDGPAFAVHAQTTDKLLLAADDGRFFTIGADKLPGARGFGEPIRNTLDIDAAAQIVALIVHKPGTQLLLASSVGRGFAAVTDELLAETRKGRQVVNLKDKVRLAVVRPIAPEHDHVAVVGDNRKLVVFSLEELPVMARGQGVTLQRYRDGGLADVTTLKLEDGLSWEMGGETGRTRTEKDIVMWKVARGAAGRRPGGPRSRADRPRGRRRARPRPCWTAHPRRAARRRGRRPTARRRGGASRAATRARSVCSPGRGPRSGRG